MTQLTTIVPFPVTFRDYGLPIFLLLSLFLFLSLFRDCGLSCLLLFSLSPSHFRDYGQPFLSNSSLLV